MKKILFIASVLAILIGCSGGTTLKGVANGYGGELTVEVTMTGDSITKVEVTEHSETVGIGTPAIEQIPAMIVEANSADVDIIAGATITSKAIINAVKNAIDPEGTDAQGGKTILQQTGSEFYQGTGSSSTAEKLGNFFDNENVHYYYLNKVYANTIFDQDGRIVSINIDQVESGTPNISNPNMPHFYGWPGQSYNYNEDHAGDVDGTIEVDEELFLSQFSEWKTKRERGETYMMTSGSWASQMNTFEETFTGMTVAEVEDWYNKYTSDINGRPLKVTDTMMAEDKAKYDALSQGEKDMLVDVTSSASMSLNDPHGNIIEAILDSYEKRDAIDITEIAAEGFGTSFIGRIGPGKDDNGVQVYSFNETFAYATFDAEDRIVSLSVDIYEVVTPNYDGDGAAVLIGWPGTSYAGYESTEENMKANANAWKTKNEKGESYMMVSGSWASQMKGYEELFIGMTVAEVEEWYNKYTSDANGRPLTAAMTDSAKAKYDALSQAEKDMLVDVTSSATMSLNDPHGDIVKAIVKAYENRNEVSIAVN